METFYNYIIESGLSLGVFTIIYWFFLRKETQLKASRIYLMVAVLFSTLLPFISLNINLFRHTKAILATADVMAETADTNLLESITVVASGFSSKVGAALISIKPTVWFYGVGATIALFMVILGLIQLYSMIAHNRKFRLKRARLVVTQKALSPYSFLNFIFISRELPQQKHWKSMVHHELEHVKQGHSFDVLFIDAMMIFQWFNPFYWLIRRMVQENHEFLADQAVLQRGDISTAQYKQLLLSQAIGGTPLMVSHFFNVKTIQKRFKMITKHQSEKFSFLKYSAGVMLALAITLLFAVNTKTQAGRLVASEIALSNEAAIAPVSVEAGSINVLELKANEAVVIKPDSLKTDVDEVFVVVEDMPEFPGGEAALRKFISENVSYPVPAAEKGIQGKVYVNFVVGKDGKVIRPVVARGVDPSLDAEALRVVSILPNWKPGKQKGIPVSVSYTIPISFEVGNTEMNVVKPNVDASGIYTIVENMPEFPGGEIALREYISKNVKYPVAAAEKGIQGKVYVRFVVDVDGKTIQPMVMRGVESSLDEEALRVVGAMPVWKPGTQKGIPVKVSYTVPINFQLNQSSASKSPDPIFVIVEEMPEYNGGQSALNQWIAENVKIPAVAIANGIKGKVYISVVIDETGKVTAPSIARGVDPLIDQAALEAISKMPDWKPGKQGGKAVKVKYTLPVNFDYK